MSRAAMIPARAVPWPFSSVVAGPPTKLLPGRTEPRGKWTLLAETPESTTATTTPLPVARDQAVRAPSRARAGGAPRDEAGLTPSVHSRASA